MFPRPSQAARDQVAERPAIDPAAYPTLRAALWLMGLLFFSANLYNIDRLIVGVLAEQIRADIHITDVQMSLLIGLAYSLLSGLFGVFLGFAADRADRSRMVAVSLAIWSLATIGGGLSAGFGGLFLARAVVGLGEAALAPAAMSLIADLFPPGRRGRALGLYSIGATLGSALSAIIPGLIVAAHLKIALLGGVSLAPWRVTFIVCGGAGLLIALLMLTAREPPRQGLNRPGKGGLRRGFATNIRYLAQHALLFAPFLLGLGLFYLALLAVTAWTTALLARKFGLTLDRFSFVLGLTLLTTGIAGYLLGGVIIDARFMRRSARKLRLMAALPLLALPSACAVFAPDPAWALVLLGTMTFVAPVLNVANGAMVQDMLPNDMRGFGLALLTVATSILGVGAGPLLVALATQHLFKQPEKIGDAMLLVAAPALVASSLCYVAAGAGLRRHLARNSPVTDIMRCANAL